MADDDTISGTSPMEAEVRSGSSGTTPEDELSEVLDEDKLPGDYPPDQPMGSFDYGVTPQEERVQEPFEERDKRYKPDDSLVGEEGRVGRLVAPDEGVHEDTEGAEVATDVDGVAPHDLPVGATQTGDSTTYDYATELTQDLSAEEAAVHEREAP